MLTSDFIREQLDSINHDIKVNFKDSYALVQCPFHKDGQETHPSLMVNLEDPRFEVGFHYCLSCSAKGGWASLAEILDLDTGVSFTSSPSNNAKPNTITTKLTGLTMHTPALYKDSAISLCWSPSDDWRSIKGELLAQLNARLRLDPRTKDKQIDLPVAMHGKVVGHIYGLLTKRDKALGPSYINSPGAWVKKALFPYDFVHNIFRQEKNASLPLCIVEGPRDALNLLQYGVPAVAILGCSNWAKTLIPSVLACRSKAVVILMDGDQAGQDAAEVIYKDLQAFLPKKGLYKFRLPVDVDPANLTQTQLETLLNYFNRIQTT